MLELIEQFNVLGAFWLNIRLAAVSFVLALVLGTVVAVLRLAPVGVLNWFGSTYVTLLRNTPLTLIIVFANLGLWAQLGLEFVPRDRPNFILENNFWLAVLGLTVYHAAFICEAIRSGVNTVPVGQAEASRSIGLTFPQSLREVILPQAFRGAITPIGNVLIALIKNTTVAVAIGNREIAYAMRNMIEFRPDAGLLIFLLVAIGFVALTLPVGLLTSWLSTRLAVKR
ncbi:amino acid ABC transporter permease [Ornithinimicrobium pekingense]|uniref:Glutamate ABC transporter permease n=1 Tax=Ornithinimicrobium pekingense TaxID=384677 RepID=A0ABQ2F4Z0_9MICO|nr:amino acid ABC transporter permease [Ornithinimicrobium pekingense]GGK61387.1 glutamate ABC transporter permease [Ornithinimicrobium pekingense]